MGLAWHFIHDNGIGNAPFTVQHHMHDLSCLSNLEQIRPTQTAWEEELHTSCSVKVEKESLTSMTNRHVNGIYLGRIQYPGTLKTV